VPDEVIDAIPSDVQASSVLELHVYAQRHLGSDDYIGGIKERADVLLAQGIAGRQFPFTFRPATLANSPMQLLIASSANTPNKAHHANCKSSLNSLFHRL
jgi:hypothetical protein